MTTRMLTLAALATMGWAMAARAEPIVDLGKYLAEVKSFDGKTLHLDVLVFESFSNRKKIDSNTDLIEYGVKVKLKEERVEVQEDRAKVYSQPVRERNGSFRKVGQLTAATTADITPGMTVTVRVKKGTKTGKLYTAYVVVHPKLP